MDAKIFRVNYKSDFILTLESDAGWLTPFCIKFWTGAPSQAYYVGWDGTTYNHCAYDPSEPTKLQVQFDDHHLPIGDLKFQVAYHFTVADFPNDTEDEVINPANITTEIDGETYKVMLDFTGETAPEIQFSLPAYANEAQRIANEQQRIANEQARIEHEEQRIANEQTRQQNEAQRIANETQRVQEFARLKRESESATTDANNAATLANAKAQLAADKAALAQAAATLANEKAQLAADKAALAQAAATLANEKAALAQQKAEYAQTQGTYAKNQGDYAKEQGDYAKEQGDTALADHLRAEADHETATSDHTRAESDHSTAASDHTTASNDHTRAESDHSTAASDHTTAGNDHTRAESDHTRAESDHAAVEVFVDSLGVFDLSKHNAVNGVLATYADLSAALTALNALESKYKYGGMSFKFVQSSDNKYAQFRLTSDSFSANPEDWSISVYSNIISNVSFIYAQTDADGKLLWGIESDGNIYYGTGVPQQVIDYVQEHKSELLSMINNKVDKIEGKGLIDQEFSDGVSFVNDMAFAYIYTDDEDKIIWGITTDGDIYYGAGVPSQIVEYVQANIKELDAKKQKRLVTDDNLTIATDVPDGYIQVENITGNTSTCRIDTGITCADNLEIECVFKDSAWDSYGAFFGRYSDENTDTIRLIYTNSNNNKGYIGFNTKASAASEVSGIVPNTKHHIIFNQQKFILDGVVTKLNVTTKGTVQEGTIIVNGTNLTTGTSTRTITWWKFIIRDANGEAVFDGVPCKRVSDGAVGLYDKVSGSFFGNAINNDSVFNAGNESENIKVNNPAPLESITAIKDDGDRIELKIDSEGKIVSYRDKDGVLHESAGIETPVVNTSKIEGLSDQGLTDLGNALKRVGFTGGQGDWTDYLSNDGENPLCIPEPRCAILNIISDFNLNNLNKKGYNASSAAGVNYDIPTQVEFWDMQGNYFKKWTLMSGQGSSSMGYTKKNIAFDFFDSEAGGDAFAIKFGDWVPQDSFHLKAYMVDFFKCLSVVSYKLAEQAAKTRPYLEDCVWKRGLYNGMNFTPSIFTTEQIDDMNLRLDSGAKCQPDGFPVIVYQNGVFHGVFAWMIKKHRDNYLMNKSNPNHIHLDGQYYTHKLFNGDLDWTTFEVRNPKNLVYATIQTDSETSTTTYKYDADIAQAEIAGNSNGSTSYDTWLAGTYAVGKIVEHGGHLFMNTVADNDAEPLYHSKNNADDAPDFKNKTGCGWLNVTNTVKVKEKIIALSGRLAEIHGAATTEEKKALAETYFDIPSLMDYELIQCAVADTDAIYNNCQWVTYDGIRWAACEYDKDDTFGNHTWLCDVRSEGGWCRSALGSDGIATDNPVGLIRSYYQTEAKTRWQELVDAGIFTTKNIINLTDDWIKRVGVGNYKKEYTKWDSRANRPTNINTEYWEYYGERYNSSRPTYNPNTEYAIGDKCKLSVGSNLYFVFNCIKPCTGEAPCLDANTSNMGWKGNIGQLYKFIEENFRLENGFFDSL